MHFKGNDIATAQELAIRNSVLNSSYLSEPVGIFCGSLGRLPGILTSSALPPFGMPDLNLQKVTGLPQGLSSSRH